MEYKVLGIENVDYENKAGRQVKGLRLHLGYEKDNVDGMCVETVFVSDRIVCNAKVCDDVRIMYNKFGSVAQIEVLA